MPDPPLKKQKSSTIIEDSGHELESSDSESSNSSSSDDVEFIGVLHTGNRLDAMAVDQELEDKEDPLPSPPATI
jgi:hypothetical protein